MALGIDAAKRMLDDAGRDGDAARARLEGVNVSLIEMKVKLQAVAAAGYALAPIMEALGAIEGAQKAVKEAGSRIGMASQRTRAAISGGL